MSTAVNKLLTVFPDGAEHLQSENGTYWLILQLLNSDQTGGDSSSDVFISIFDRLAAAGIPRNHSVVRSFAEWASQYQRKFNSHIPAANLFPN